MPETLAPFLDTGTAAFAADPHPIFDALRPAGPVVRDAIGWSTIDYATSEAAFHDPALTPGIDHLLASRGIEHLWGAPGHTLTDSEGEAHQRLRRAVSPWFSVRRNAELRTRTQALVAEMLAPFGPSTRSCARSPTRSARRSRASPPTRRSFASRPASSTVSSATVAPAVRRRPRAPGR